jgi:hypothetical protein
MTGQTGSFAILMNGLFDDASLFPPADLPMSAALAGHAAHQAAWYRDMTGPFVCPDARIGALRLALTAAGVPEIDISLVVTAGAGGLEAAVDEVAADPRLRLRAVEVPVRRHADVAAGAVPQRTAEPGVAEPGVAELAAVLDRTPLAGAAAYMEIPLADFTENVLDAVAGHGYRPKLRTGGAVAGAFPGEDLLAGCLVALADRRLAFKCTAGLHRGVRHAASETGFEHHGFLNVLLAVAAALEGAGRGDVAAVLADRDSGQVAGQIRKISADQAMMVRSLFSSFGTCSIDEPVADLVALGLAGTGPTP